jgi:hypothetical protein
VISKVHKGQVYRSVGEVEHLRQDGTKTTLTRWRSECATCGEEFEFTTPTTATNFNPNRRCAKHRKPGRAV